MEIDTEALHTPKVGISEVSIKSPPLLVPSESVNSFQRSSEQTCLNTKESDPDIGTRRNSFVDLDDYADNEFILLPPNALPRISIKTHLHPQGEVDDSSEYDAMEVEAINSHVESSIEAEQTVTRSRSVTLDDPPSSVIGYRFRLPCIRLQPRGWTRSASREAPWESFHGDSSTV